LRHRVFHFALRGVLEGLVRRVGGVFDELRDFDCVPEKHRRHLRDVACGSRTLANVAADQVREVGLASRTELQRKPHVARADAFHVATLLDHSQQDVVPLVKQRKLIADLIPVAAQPIAGSASEPCDCGAVARSAENALRGLKCTWNAPRISYLQAERQARKDPKLKPSYYFT